MLYVKLKQTSLFYILLRQKKIWNGCFCMCFFVYHNFFRTIPDSDSVTAPNIKLLLISMFNVYCAICLTILKIEFENIYCKRKKEEKKLNKSGGKSKWQNRHWCFITENRWIYRGNNSTSLAYILYFHVYHLFSWQFHRLLTCLTMVCVL